MSELNQSDLDQAIEQKKKLYARLAEARKDHSNSTTAIERSKHQERVRVLREMYKEACAEVRRLDPSRISEQKMFKKNQSSNIAGAALVGAVWADIEGYTWSQVEGRRWDDLPSASSGRMAKVVMSVVQEGIARCTPNQQQLINDYYVEELTLQEIQEKRGIDTSTVSRTLTRARRRIKNYAEMKLVLSYCIDEDGKFDYMRFANNVVLLTDRQRECLFFMLSDNVSINDIALYINRTPSTVWRTFDVVSTKLNGAGLGIVDNPSNITIDAKSWIGISQEKLAETLGLTRYFYYKHLHRGERVNDIPLHHCVVLHYAKQFENPKLVATHMGCSPVTVKRLVKAYQNYDIPDIKDDYNPRKIEKIKLPDNIYVALASMNTPSSATVLDCIDGETYQRLMQKFGGQ